MISKKEIIYSIVRQPDNIAGFFDRPILLTEIIACMEAYYAEIKKDECSMHDNVSAALSMWRQENGHFNDHYSISPPIWKEDRSNHHQQVVYVMYSRNEMTWYLESMITNMGQTDIKELMRREENHLYSKLQRMIMANGFNKLFEL